MTVGVFLEFICETLTSENDAAYYFLMRHEVHVCSALDALAWADELVAKCQHPRMG
jgi:hypothetical protein